MKKLKDYFEKLRFDKDHHQGLGDIRLTLAQQEEIIQMVDAELRLSAVMPSLPIERFDAEDWLGENKDIWHHPIVTDRTNKESYEVADLMAEFAMSFFGQ